jgi:hypothetical protein
MVSSAVKRTSCASSSRHMRLICGFNTLSICFRSWYGAVRIDERRRQSVAYLGIAPRQKFACDAAAVLCMNHFSKDFLASGHIMSIGENTWGLSYPSKTSRRSLSLSSSSNVSFTTDRYSHKARCTMACLMAPLSGLLNLDRISHRQQAKTAGWRTLT